MSSPTQGWTAVEDSQSNTSGWEPVASTSEDAIAQNKQTAAAAAKTMEQDKPVRMLGPSGWVDTTQKGEAQQERDIEARNPFTHPLDAAKGVLQAVGGTVKTLAVEGAKASVPGIGPKLVADDLTKSFNDTRKQMNETGQREQAQGNTAGAVINSMGANLPLANSMIQDAYNSQRSNNPHENVQGLGRAGANVGMLATGLAEKGVTPRPFEPTDASIVKAQAARAEALTAVGVDHEIAQRVEGPLRDEASNLGVDTKKLEKLPPRQQAQAYVDVMNKAVDRQGYPVDELLKEHQAAPTDARPVADYYSNLAKQAREERIGQDYEAQAKWYEAEAERWSKLGQTKLGTLDAMRKAYNKEVGDYYKRPADETPWKIEAKEGAAHAIRDLEYGELSKRGMVSQDEIVKIKQREGELIRTRNAAREEMQGLSRAEAEYRSKTLREKVAGTYPSKHGAMKSAVKATLGVSPMDAFNKRMQTVFKDLPKQQAPEFAVKTGQQHDITQAGFPVKNVTTVEVTRGGQNIGTVKARPVGTNTWQVYDSVMKEQERGRGYATQAYVKMAEQARKSGVTKIQSSPKETKLGSRTGGTDGVWKRLQEQFPGQVRKQGQGDAAYYEWTLPQTPAGLKR